MQNTYKFLLDCEEMILKELKHGKKTKLYFFGNLFSFFEDVPLCDVYKLIREKIENERPELANKMTNNLQLDLYLNFIESLNMFRLDLCPFIQEKSNTLSFTFNNLDTQLEEFEAFLKKYFNI